MSKFELEFRCDITKHHDRSLREWRAPAGIECLDAARRVITDQVVTAEDVCGYTQWQPVKSVYLVIDEATARAANAATGAFATSWDHEVEVAPEAWLALCEYHVMRFGDGLNVTHEPTKEALLKLWRDSGYPNTIQPPDRRCDDEDSGDEDVVIVDEDEDTDI